jgi:trimeric autotransporter adhesin
MFCPWRPVLAVSASLAAAGAVPQTAQTQSSHTMKRRAFVWRQDPNLPPRVALSDIRVVINGAVVRFPDHGARLLGDRVFVPMRGVFEKLGATVQWNAEEQLVSAFKNGRTILLFIGQDQAIVDGRRIPLDHPAVLLRGRVMVPLRFLSESLGANVDWRSDQMTVQIKT